MIDWSSLDNEVLINPRMPEATKSELLKALAEAGTLQGQVCFATSGSSGNLKWAVLSKSGILSSAKSVNDHLKSDRSDIWLNALPPFHVGGVGIAARAHLSGAKVHLYNFPAGKWNPQFFSEQLEQSQATLTSLVPTQVFDLVSQGITPPESLRAIIVGGGAMSEQVYFSAVKLGWKLLPSYGLTECASQVATAIYGSWNTERYPTLAPLSHIVLDTDENGFLKIKSDALLTAYIEGHHLRDPKIEGWFTTEDMAVFEGRCIKSIHRGEHFVKIGGESVDLLRLEKILEEEKLAIGFPGDAALAAMDDARLGSRIHLAVVSPHEKLIDTLVARYHDRVLPFERVSLVHRVQEIPRSPLNKVLRAHLKVILNQTINKSENRGSYVI